MSDGTPGDDDSELSPPLTGIVCRLALEGIPVRAIARGINMPAQCVRTTLAMAQSSGTIVDLPKEDWPPTGSIADHLPGFRPRDPASLEFYAIQKFRLTKLMAKMLLVLVKREHAEKSVLHGVIEDCRSERAAGQPDKELTDQKMVDVMVCKLRQRLKQVDAKIIVRTAWGNGYFMDRETRTYVLKLLTTEADSAQSFNPEASADADPGAATNEDSLPGRDVLGGGDQAA